MLSTLTVNKLERIAFFFLLFRFSLTLIDTLDTLAVSHLR